MAFRAKRVRKVTPASVMNNRSLLEFDFDIDSDDLVHLSLSADEQEMRSDLINQIKEAFLAEPTINGVLYGVRMVRLGKEGSRSGYFPSIKNAHGALMSVSLPVESRAEARYALELERDETVRAFRTQAVQLAVPGQKSPVYPDFLILDQRGRLHLREVKQDVNHLSDEYMKRFEHLKKILYRWGISYALVDISEMPDERKYENLLWLYRELITYPTSEQVSEFLQVQFGKKTIKELTQFAEGKGWEASVVFYSLFKDALRVNWGKTLNTDTEVCQ